MNIKKIALTGALALATLASVGAAQLPDKDKQFLAGYKKIHTALVADDLSAAKAAGKDLGSEGGDVANASSLKDARAGFEKLSDRAKSLASGQPGYHVMHCPMLNKDWVQPSKEVSNPYGGKEMLTCGEVKS